tara:strand:- start:110 stop:436 length:327 start_codon:yes stop_codon:yes gene_type:complete
MFNIYKNMSLDSDDSKVVSVLNHGSFLDNIASVVSQTVEGFSGGGVEGHHTYDRNMLIFVILMKLLLLFIVSNFLWPRVMPKLFTNVTKNPEFVSIIGLSVIVSLIRA